MSAIAAPTVSCIIPVYNGERFVREAITTVLDQRYPRLEVIVVDDGSTDGSLRVLREFEGIVRVIRQPHRGVAAARNQGLGEAHGDYVAFQDADDVWMPGKLALQVARLRERPDAEICLGRVQNFWMEELAHEEAAFRGHQFAGPVPGFVLACLLARAAAFRKVGPFNTALRVGSDTEWFMRAREAGLVETSLPEILVRRRLHAGNLTRTDLASRDALLASMKASLDRRRGRSGPAAGSP